MDVHAEAGEDFLPPAVGRVTDEAVVDDFGNQAGGGDAALLQGWRQRRDDGLGGGIVDADVFGPHELDAVELGWLEAELPAHFLAGAAEGGGFKPDFGGNDLFAPDGQMIRDAWGAGLLPALPVVFDFSRRSGDSGSGGVGLFCLIRPRHEFGPHGIELLAGDAEDASADGVDGLPQHEIFSGKTLDDGIAFGDFIEQLLFSRGIHC